MGQAEEIVCVQPNCARRTRDFYQVNLRTALELPDVQAGPTCVPCYEDIVRRTNRPTQGPRTRWLPDPS